jgi:hypothetical protein
MFREIELVFFIHQLDVFLHTALPTPLYPRHHIGDHHYQREGGGLPTQIGSVSRMHATQWMPSHIPSSLYVVSDSLQTAFMRAYGGSNKRTLSYLQLSVEVEE